MSIFSEVAPSGRKRISVKRIGCLAVVCVIAVTIGLVGWRVYKVMTYFGMERDVSEKLRSLESKRPADITEEHWKEATGWAYTAFGNLPLGSPDNQAPMQDFYAAFKKQMATGDSLATLRWVWDELERRNPRGPLYAQTWKPMRAMTPDPITDDTLKKFWGKNKCGVLDLRDTQITDSGLRYLRRFPELYHLFLGHTRVTDAGLAHLKTNPNLQYLQLAQTLVGDPGLKNLAGMKLDSIDLTGTQVTDAGMTHLQTLPKLISLSVVQTNIGDQGLENLAGMKLRWLDLSDTQVTDAGMACLKALPNLQDLKLKQTRVGDQGLKNLAGMTLDSLDVGGTQVTDAGMIYLQALPNLQELSLEQTNIDDAGLEQLAKTKLKWINLTGTRVTDSGVEQFHRALPGCKIWPVIETFGVFPKD